MAESHLKSRPSEPVHLVQEIMLTHDDFVYILENMIEFNSVPRRSGFQIDVHEDEVVLKANRPDYTVEIIIAADDNSTCMPKLTIDVCSDKPLSLIFLRGVVEQELRIFTERLLGFPTARLPNSLPLF